MEVTPELILQLAREQCIKAGEPVTPENLLWAACCVASDYVKANAKLMSGGFYRKVQK